LPKPIDAEKLLAELGLTTPRSAEAPEH